MGRCFGERRRGGDGSAGGLEVESGDWLVLQVKREKAEKKGEASRQVVFNMQSTVQKEL